MSEAAAAAGAAGDGGDALRREIQERIERHRERLHAHKAVLAGMPEPTRGASTPVAHLAAVRPPTAGAGTPPPGAGTPPRPPAMPAAATLAAAAPPPPMLSNGGPVARAVRRARAWGSREAEDARPAPAADEAARRRKAVEILAAVDASLAVEGLTNGGGAGGNAGGGGGGSAPAPHEMVLRAAAAGTRGAPSAPAQRRGRSAPGRGAAGPTRRSRSVEPPSRRAAAPRGRSARGSPGGRGAMEAGVALYARATAGRARREAVIAREVAEARARAVPVLSARSLAIAARLSQSPMQRLYHGPAAAASAAAAAGRSGSPGRRFRDPVAAAAAAAAKAGSAPSPGGSPGASDEAARVAGESADRLHADAAGRAAKLAALKARVEESALAVCTFRPALVASSRSFAGAPEAGRRAAALQVCVRARRMACPR